MRRVWWGVAGLWVALTACAPLRGSGDLGVVVERATGSVQIVENTHNTPVFRVEGMGDLSHASAVFSRDARHVYLFGRDGGVSKVDLLTGRLVARVVQAGNSIGGAISQDGRWVAVANYEPGGVRILDAETLEVVADIPAEGADGRRSKVVGLADIPGSGFVFTLFDSGEIWVVDLKQVRAPAVKRYLRVGAAPYDALITPDGRHYLAGLFGEDGVAHLDLWRSEEGVKRILPHYGRGEEKLPVYKMPHLRGWAVASGMAFLPAVGRRELLVVDLQSWKEQGRVSVHGQPVFAMARPDGRQVWVNFALPNNDTVQVVDVVTRQVVKTLKPGKGVMHMEFTARGERVWMSLRDEDRVEVYDTETFERVATLPAVAPSGIFFSHRAHRIGL